jgi:GGDEF domain-containing protein
VKYSRFELLALSVGSVSLVGVVLATLRNGPLVEEVVAQALLFVVLVGAVHWGRRGGMVTFALAVLAYFLMRAPLIAREGLSPDVLTLVLVRTFTYGVVGVAGGELCSRIRYFLARLDDGSNIDEPTGLFNQRYISAMLRSMIGQHERYGESFSVVTLRLSASLTAALRPTRQRSLLRAVGTGIRNDVRLVDDVARLDDGRFLLVLPHTDRRGARVVAERVSAGVRRLLGAKEEAVATEVLGVEEDLAALQELCGFRPAEPPGRVSLSASA